MQTVAAAVRCVAVYSTADSRLGVSTDAWSQMASHHPHGTSPAAHTNAGSCGYLSIAGRKEMLIRSTRSASAAQASYSLIQCFVHTCTQTYTSLPTRSRLCTPHSSSSSLFIVRLLVLGRLLRSSRRVDTSTTSDFSPPDRFSTPSRIRHKLPQCPRRREARCKAVRSKRPRHRMYITQVASQRG